MKQTKNKIERISKFDRCSRCGEIRVNHEIVTELACSKFVEEDKGEFPGLEVKSSGSDLVRCSRCDSSEWHTYHDKVQEGWWCKHGHKGIIRPVTPKTAKSKEDKEVAYYTMTNGKLYKNGVEVRYSPEPAKSKGYPVELDAIAFLEELYEVDYSDWRNINQIFYKHAKPKGGE